MCSFVDIEYRARWQLIYTVRISVSSARTSLSEIWQLCIKLTYWLSYFEQDESPTPVMHHLLPACEDGLERLEGIFP